VSHGTRERDTAHNIWMDYSTCEWVTAYMNEYTTENVNDHMNGYMYEYMNEYI